MCLMPVPVQCLLDRLHGKKGVDGSSPSEGLQNPRSRGFFVQKDLLFVARAVGMEPFMELSRSRGAKFVVCEDNMADARKAALQLPGIAA
jgi:hypothetical protein